MKHKILVALLVFLMASGCCATLKTVNSSFWGKKENKDIYVDQTVGNDDNLGTAKKPLKTIQKAFNKTPDNGTIHLTEGTYTLTENTELNQHNLTIVGVNRDKVIISGDNKVRYLRNNGYNGDSLSLENLTITHFIGQAIFSGYLTVRNCIFLKNSNPISCNYYALIDHCLFKENYNTRNRSLISLPGAYDFSFNHIPTVVNCDFKNNEGVLIECHGGYYNSNININGCNFINQPGICLRFKVPDISHAGASARLGGDYWDGAKDDMEVIKKIEGINSFNYRVLEEPLDNGYNNY